MTTKPSAESEVELPRIEDTFGLGAVPPMEALRQREIQLKAALRDKKAAEQERDALLEALGWEVGSLARAKELVLDDARKLRPELIKARREREDAQADAFLWRCFKEDRPALLNTVWKQKKAAEAALAAANQIADEATRLLKQLYESSGGDKRGVWDFLNPRPTGKAGE